MKKVNPADDTRRNRKATRSKIKGLDSRVDLLEEVLRNVARELSRLLKRAK